MSLEGKVALVTGAARGLGRAYAEALLQRKAKVMIADVLDDIGETTAGEFCTQYGAGHAAFIHGDVTSDKSMQNVVETTVSRFGHLDILINNAGIGGKLLKIGPTIGINLNGVIRTTDIALEYMRKDQSGNGGVIINIGSIAGLTVMPGGAIYHASKHGVVGYTRSTAMMMGENTGMKVVCLCPSFVKTDMTAYLQESESSGDERVLKILESVGGWVNLDDVVSTCMTCIEDDKVQNNSVILVSGKGPEYVKPVLEKSPFP